MQTDSVTLMVREKGTESNKILLSNTTYQDYYVERWQLTKCNTIITEEKYLLPQTTEIWFCKSTEEVHKITDCNVDIKDETMCYYTETEYYLCKEAWVRISKLT